MKSCFSNLLSACFHQLSQSLLGAVKFHTTAQRGTNVAGREKIKQSFQDVNLNQLPTHCSHAKVTALLSRPVIQPMLTLGRARTFGSGKNIRKNLVGRGAAVCYFPPDMSSKVLCCFEKVRSPKTKTQETLYFQRTTLSLKRNLGL